MHTYEYILTVPLDYGPKLLSLDARIACDYLSTYSHCDVFRMPALLARNSARTASVHQDKSPTKSHGTT